LVENLYQQILNQTHSDWEWIVTDDFSDYNNAKDILLEICSKDPRVKYYEQSRKKECFYNPQYGCTGDIIIQFDSDDYAYPKILEIYNHMFLKHPDVMGISCLSHTIDQQNNFVDIQGGGTYKFEENSTFNYTPMGRAWRNIITEFDDGTLKWYQNDTNIVRHIENKGKWLYLPRTLYRYYYSQDTFSREANRTPEIYDEIENERIYIENKFPHLYNSNKLTTSLYYLPIHQTARSLGFGDFNLSKTRQTSINGGYDIPYLDNFTLINTITNQISVLPIENVFMCPLSNQPINSDNVLYINSVIYNGNFVHPRNGVAELRPDIVTLDDDDDEWTEEEPWEEEEETIIEITMTNNNNNEI
jgi:glycosyltransferase involved in cell wall biosynthesis